MRARRGGAPLLGALLVLLFGSTAALEAQSRSTAALRGRVLSETGAALQGAFVELRDERTGRTKETLTSIEGNFLLLQLQPGGPYTLRVRLLGYGDRTVEGVQLDVGNTFRVDVRLTEQALEIEGLSVEVDRVTDFNVNEVGPATRIDERTIEAMPILSRDVMELAALSPLVRTTEGGGFSVAGQNDRYNAILVDGQFSQDMFGLTSGGLPGGQAGAKLIPIDAVAQYEVLVAPYDVRLAGFTGGVMNAVTRMGTNDWRGRISAVHRNEALIGDLSLPTGPVSPSGVDRSLVAASLGGPILRDRAHFFSAVEIERQRRPPNGFNLLRDDPALIRISEEQVDAFSRILEEDFGADVGEAGPLPLERVLANSFTRIDANFDGGDRLTFRHLFAHAENDDDPNRRPFQPYELSSNGVSRRSTSNIASVQYFRELAEGVSNELDVSFQRSVDRTEPMSSLPQIEVGLTSSVDGAAYQRNVRAGGQFFAQENDLEQTSLRLTNSVDIQVGDDVVTLGVAGSWLGVRNSFLPGSRGEWLFASLSDLEQNAPFRYQRTVLADGEPDAIDFSVAQAGAFVQRQLNAGKGLTMHFGLRVDVPFVLGRPDPNYDLQAFFGYDTSDLPSGNLLISPRFGFNWQSEGERKTQVRSGGGLFSGQIPFVWLSNAFHDNGLRSQIQLCEGRRFADPRPSASTPEMQLGAPLDSCLVGGRAGTPGRVPFRTIRNAVVFDPSFRYPQDLRFSIVVDQELTDRTVASFGVLFNTAFNQVAIEDLNLVPGAPADSALIALAGRNRRYYSRVTDEYDHILAITNQGENVALAATAEVRGGLGDRFSYRLGYSLTRSWDRTSLVHTDMISNIGNTPVVSDINRPPLETSNFDRPHKFVASIFGAPIPSLPNTEFSLLYSGQSGLPFTYVYWGDVNGDGYPGIGGAFDRNNDPVHIPGIFPIPPITFSTRALLESALENDPCLAGLSAGDIVDRNACRAPFEHRLDLRVTHGFTVGGRDVRLEADLLNLLSLFDPSWGRVQRTSPLVPLLELCQVGCEVRGRLPARWGGGVLPREGEDGRVLPSDPWVPVVPESQWRMQIGARVSFGGDA